MTTTTPIWLGTDDRPLLGFFHTPEHGMARAGVVVCPPFDRDYMHAHYALRILAERLADLGMCALRFDYDGTGDSAGGPGDPDRVTSWLGSVTAAIDVVRAAGASSTVLVGMRVGATFAGVVAERDGGLDGLVLWDPVVSGRAYLSEQRALSALSLNSPKDQADGSVETPGMLFDSTTARDLRSLDLSRTSGPLARKVLVLPRPDRETGRLAKRLDLPHVEWAEASGQAELMDVGSPNQLIPYDAIDRIGNWVSAIAPESSSPVRCPLPAGGAVVGRGTDGTPVVETPIFLGPSGLFGVLTDVPGRTAGPTALFLNVANEHRVGPARLWVDLAREWAAAGMRSFRLDLSGLGDSPTRRPDQRRFVTRAPEAFDDVVDASRALCPDDPSAVVLVGLCASGYQALDSAFDVRPRGVVAINPILSFRPPELVAGDAPDPRRHVAIPRTAATQAFHGNGPGAGLRHRFPRLGSRARDLSEVLEGLLAAPRRRPAVWLRELTGQGVDVLLVCGEREARPVRLSGSARSFRRLDRTGLFHLDLVPGLEHGLLIAEQRAEVRERVTQHVLRLSGCSGGDKSPSDVADPDVPLIGTAPV
jgi:alpha-beta hydrolase superfamily lysophospholipase